MTYTEAIRMALSGDERGYTFLYEETYKSKMYLAIQYMKNEDDAMDILQDAYVKAFAKLNTLQDPEKFPSWFGMIVANTAKNALVKKNPVLFTDLSTDPDTEPFEYSIEDENLSHQPEFSYTSEETRLLVHEMMNALSEEQRVCVLMFHIDGIPIREIAETLGCSENTVKSRLNYARKNIKKQGEELQKKGYQLYGIAPFTLLLLLLHRDASAMSGEADFLAAGAKVEQAVFQNGLSFAGEAAGSTMAGEGAGTAAVGDVAGTGAAGNSVAGTAAKSAAGAAVKRAFLSTVAGKITISVIGAALIGGAAFGVSRVVQNNQNQSTSAVVQETDGMGILSSEKVPETVEGVAVETESELESEWESAFETELLLTETESDTELAVETESETESESETERIAETESGDIPAVVSISDVEFPDLLEGNLTKEELEFVIAYRIVFASDYTGTAENQQYTQLLQFCSASFCGAGILTELGEKTVTFPLGDTATRTTTYRGYSVDELNRLLSIFTDFRLTGDYSYSEEDEYVGTYVYAFVEEDTIWITTVNMSSLLLIDITDAFIHDGDLIVRYDISHDPPVTEAESSGLNILHKNENGKYQFTRNISLDTENETETSGETDTGVAETEGLETETSGTEAPETERVIDLTLSGRQIADDEYVDLLEGSLTKEELEFVLAYVSGNQMGDAISYESILASIRHLCCAALRGESNLESVGEFEDDGYIVKRITEETGGGYYNFIGFLADDINRLLSVFADYRFTEGYYYEHLDETDVNYDHNYLTAFVWEDTFWVSLPTLFYTKSVAITETVYSNDQLLIYYDLYSDSWTPENTENITSTVYSKVALLQKNENGNFQIVQVTTLDTETVEKAVTEIET